MEQLGLGKEDVRKRQNYTQKRNEIRGHFPLISVEETHLEYAAIFKTTEILRNFVPVTCMSHGVCELFIC